MPDARPQLLGVLRFPKRVFLPQGERLKFSEDDVALTKSLLWQQQSRAVEVALETAAWEWDVSDALRDDMEEQWHEALTDHQRPMDDDEDLKVKRAAANSVLVEPLVRVRAAEGRVQWLDISRQAWEPRAAAGQHWMTAAMLRVEELLNELADAYRVLRAMEHVQWNCGLVHYVPDWNAGPHEPVVQSTFRKLY